jgi:hypothetical protein
VPALLELETVDLRLVELEPQRHGFPFIESQVGLALPVNGRPIMVAKDPSTVVERMILDPSYLIA